MVIERIRTLREDRDLSQNYIADILNVGQKTILIMNWAKPGFHWTALSG